MKIELKNPLQRTAAKLLAGFFALMLLFTIVSRAAQGMAIALVRAETAKAGTISERIELTGLLQPLEDMDVLLPGNLYVTDVKAAIGQNVAEGDVLLEFDLEDARAQLREQENSLAGAEAKLAATENAAGGADTGALANAELNLRQAQEDYARLEAKLERSAARAQEDYANAQADLKDAQAKYAETLSKTRRDMVDAAMTKRDAAQKALSDAKTAAREAIAQAESAADTAKEARVAEAQQAYNDALWAYGEALAGKGLEDQQAVVSAQNGVKSAEKALNSAKRSLEDNGTSIDDQLLNSARGVATAQRGLEQAQRDAAEKARAGEISAKQAEVDLLTQRAQIDSLQKAVGALREITAMEGRLLSPVEGTVRAITKTGKTQDRVAVATLSRADMGFQFEAKLGGKSAESLALGDTGQLSYRNGGGSQRAQATVTGIGAADEEGNCLVLASLPDGTYPAGANGTMTVARGSERQNTCLPVSALRSDSDGDYVFVLEEKRAVTGLEYTAKRIDVTVLMRDSSLASVQGGMARDDKVVTSANKPIAEGDKVRLDED